MKAPTLPALLTSSLVGISVLLVTWLTWNLVDKKEKLVISRGQLQGWVFPIVFAFSSLGYYCWRLHKAFDLKIVRREKIAKWRSDLDSSWGRGDFVSSSLYQEIRSYLSEATIVSVEEVDRSSAIFKWEEMSGHYGNTVVSESKILLLRDIGKVEKLWGLI